MYENIIVNSRRGSYPIYFGDIKHVAQHLASARKVMLLTDANIANLHLDYVVKQLTGFKLMHHILPEGEDCKTLASLEQAAAILVEAGFDKSCQLVGFGGGAVGDLTGLLAAMYHRGIPYIQMPTSLLAMVDAAIGGKTAINHRYGKNLLGVINPPELIVMDLHFLQTLSQKAYCSALSEVIKYGLVLDQDFLFWFESNIHKILARESTALQYIIKRSCQLKASVVSQDEFEQGKRVLLNFGHTLGHALENLLGYGRIPHGEAVAIGLYFATTVSHLLGMVTVDVPDRVVKLLQQCNLPTTMGSILSKQELINSMQIDKKSRAGKINMVLLQDLGHGELAIDVPLDTIEAALGVILES
jgi:3-dehydroquinate synthase